MARVMCPDVGADLRREMEGNWRGPESSMVKTANHKGRLLHVMTMRVHQKAVVVPYPTLKPIS